MLHFPVLVQSEAILEKPYPYDDGQGLVNTHGGVLEPVWSCGPIMPTSLVHILVTCDREAVDVGEEEERHDGEMGNIELDDLTDSDDDRCQLCYVPVLHNGQCRVGRFK